MSIIRSISTALVAIGGLNWGLVGFFDFDLVAWIFGEDSTGARIVYAAVGIATLVMLATFAALIKQPRRTHAG